MQPGMELDALVAQAMGHVIEWRWCSRDPECFGENMSGFDEVESIYDGGDEVYTAEKLQLMAERDSFSRLPCIVTDDSDGEKYYQVCWPYSTKWEAAAQAWEWLEENHPWTYHGTFSRGPKSNIMLGRNLDNVPSVLVMVDFWDGPTLGFPSESGNFFIAGESYPHAIALAVIETTKTNDPSTIAA